jgi:hypothetical protein
MPLMRRAESFVTAEPLPPGGAITTPQGRIVTEEGDYLVIEGGVETVVRAADMHQYVEVPEAEIPAHLRPAQEADEDKEEDEDERPKAKSGKAKSQSPTAREERNQKRREQRASAKGQERPRSTSSERDRDSKDTTPPQGQAKGEQTSSQGHHVMQASRTQGPAIAEDPAQASQQKAAHGFSLPTEDAGKAPETGPKR